MLADIVWDQNTVMWVCIFAVPIASILGGIWYKIERVRSDNELKRTMIERGMSAEEIERVIVAKPAKE
jgi:hypothetical protein